MGKLKRYLVNLTESQNPHTSQDKGNLVIIEKQ